MTAKTRTTNYALAPHQEAFVNDTQHRYVGLVGGYGSGKTYAACHKAVKLALLNKGLDGALMEPIQSMIRGTLMPVFKEVLDEHLKLVRGKHYTYRKSNPESIIFHFPEGDSTIFLCGAENYERLAGKNLAWFIIDEIDRCSTKEVAIKAFTEATMRIRAPGARTQGCVTTTPEGFHFRTGSSLRTRPTSPGRNRDSLAPIASCIAQRHARTRSSHRRTSTTFCRAAHQKKPKHA